MKKYIFLSLLILFSGQLFGKSQFLLKGSVVSHEGAPMAGLNVSVYEKNLRNEELLGNVMTDAGGGYLIRYTMNNDRNSIIIKVSGKNNQILYKSNIINPTRNEFLRIIIPKRNIKASKMK